MQHFYLMPEKSEFGQRLKLAFAGASNGVIGSKLGLRENTVGFYVRGRIPDADVLIKIANITGCSIDWLLTGEKPRFVVPKEETVHIQKPIMDRLRIIAREQSKVLHESITDLGSSDILEAVTLTSLVEFLICKCLENYGLIETGDLLKPLDWSEAERFTFVRNDISSLDSKMREMIQHELGKKGVAEVAQETDIRDMIREIVKEEVSNSRKRPVYPLVLSDAENEKLEQKTRKAG